MADADGGGAAVATSAPAASAPSGDDNAMEVDAPPAPVAPPPVAAASAEPTVAAVVGDVDTSAGEKRRREDEGEDVEIKRPRADDSADVPPATAPEPEPAEEKPPTPTPAPPPPAADSAPPVTAAATEEAPPDQSAAVSMETDMPTPVAAPPPPVKAPPVPAVVTPEPPAPTPAPPPPVAAPPVVPGGNGVDSIGHPAADMSAMASAPPPTDGEQQTRVTNQLQWIGTKLLKTLVSHPQSWPFRVPVDPVALKLPTYFDVIKNPMDLSTVRTKIKERRYWSGQDAIADLRLIWSNCRLFNRPGDDVCKMAEFLEKYMDQKLKQMPHPEVEVVPNTKKRRGPGIALERVDANPITNTPPHSGGSVPGRRSSSRPVRPPVKDIVEEQLLSLQPSVVRKTGRKMTERMKFCHGLIRELMHKKHQDYAWPFMKPVDAAMLGLSDYYDIIKKPMDLGTVRKKLDANEYPDADAFIADIDLIFTNCYTYNPKDHDVVKLAKELHHVYVMKKAQMPARDEAEERAVARENAMADSPTDSRVGRAASKGASKSSRSVPTIAESGEDDDSDDDDSSSEDSSDDSSEASFDGDAARFLYFKTMLEKMESKMKKKKKKKKKNKSSKVKAPKAAKTKSSAGKSKKQPKQKSAPSKKKPASSSRKAKAAPVMHAAPVAAAPVASRKKNARKAASSDEASSDSSDDNDEDEMTWDQKRELSQDVNDLSEEHLHQVVNIIKKREKGLSGSSDEIEIDFAQLQNSTLRALQEFVASTKNPKKKGKKKNAPMTAAEKEADIQRRLANVNSQLGDNSPSRQPWADDESSRPRSGGVGGQRSSEGDADSVAQAQPVPPKKTATPSSRPSKRPSAPTTSLLVAASSEVPSSNEVVSFDTARRIESGGVPGTPAVELLQATTAVATEDEDIQVENASAWLSFGTDSANGAGGASAPADSDASDFSKFQRLQEEKKVRDQTDAEEAERLEKERVAAELRRKEAAEQQRLQRERMQADKLKQQEEEDAKQRADELAERERLREEAKREREAMTGHMDLHEQGQVMAAFGGDADDDDDDLDNLLEG